MDISGLITTGYSITVEVPDGVPFPHIMEGTPGPLFQPNINSSAVLTDTIVVYDGEQLLSAFESLVAAPKWTDPIIVYVFGNISLAGVKDRWPAAGFTLPGNITLQGPKSTDVSSPYHLMLHL